MIERRRFSRVIYQAPAELKQGNVVLNANLRDLSLHGLLLSSPDERDQLDQNLPMDVHFTLPESDVVLSLQAEIVELNENYIRISIQHIDIDSISHLKRLIELNVGDETLLHREIEQLSDLGA